MAEKQKEAISIKGIFGVRHDEYAMAAIMAALLLVLHYFFISRFFHQFADYSEQSRYVFLANFHMAGFDPTAYDVMARWKMGYDILRHPILAWLMWPLYALNQGLWLLTGMNCAQFINGALLFGCAFYSAIFMYRLLSRAVGTSRLGATLLTLLFFSFAYIMVSVIVPDHFGISMFLLILTIYMSTFHHTTTLQQGLLYMLTAGVTLTNGVVVFAGDCISDWRKATSKRRILLAYVVPTLLLLGSVACFQRQIASSTKWVEHDVARHEIVMENMFGESIQFHRKHILGDVLWRRPVIVRYLWWGSYAIEAMYVLLFAAGIWYGRKEKLTWLLTSILAFTILLHIVCGFAANEIQIMTAHWAFVIPLAMGYVERRHKWASILIALLTAYLLASNFYLLHHYLTWPLTYK